LRDTQRILRHAIRDLLAGQLSWDGTAVPVYDEKKRDKQSADLFVILSTQQETDNNTDTSWTTDSSIDIEITHKTEFEVSKDAIDEISDQILEILLPTPDGPGWEVGGFLIQNIRRSSTITRNFSVTDSQSIVAKIITITSKITQQFP
jgi:hypothetical protein